MVIHELHYILYLVDTIQTMSVIAKVNLLLQGLREMRPGLQGEMCKQ